MSILSAKNFSEIDMLKKLRRQIINKAG